MSDAVIPLTSDDMRLIAEIGFIGTQSGQLAASRALFEALQVLRPQSTLPHIGRALAALEAQRGDDAIRILRDEALQQHPGDAEVMAFLGLALHNARRTTEARQVLNAVVTQEGMGNEPAIRMAQKLLALDSRTSASPASLMPRWSEKAQKAAEPAGR
jgi:Flp pilus assembly protein TadD